GNASDKIKSDPTSDIVGFHHEVISSIADGFIQSAGTDRVKKEKDLLKQVFFFFGAADET
ncbi:MAG: hypothetical protein IKY46_06710, partial [Clostridia bacterium]|nr:hypothetical protein [Clostridia bacterium]